MSVVGPNLSGHKTSPPPGGASESIWVSARDGARVISFPKQTLWSWAEVSTFEMMAPTQTPSDQLRATRASLTSLQAQFDLNALELILQRRFRTSPNQAGAPHEPEQRQTAFPELHLKAAGSTIICWGVYHPAQQRPTPFYLEAALHPSPQSLRVDLFRGFVFGVSASSAAQLAAELMRAAQLPALPSHPSALQIDPLTELSLAMCLERGWKLPSRECALSARASGGSVILTVGDGAEPYQPSGAYSEHLKRLKEISEGEQLLYRGEERAALQFYQQLEPSPFSLLRVAELIRSKKLNPMQRAEAIGWLNATLRLEQPLAPLARSWQLELRGEQEAAAEALEEWWRLASALPDERLARDPATLRGVAAYSRALLLEHSQPQRALEAFEEARVALPRSLGVLSGSARVALALSDIPLADQRLSEQAQLLEGRGLKPEAAWAWVQVAEVRRSLANQTDPKAAERAFTRALELEPTLISAHQGLAAIAEERGEYMLACERLDHALKVVVTRGPARAALEEMRQRFDQLSRPMSDLTPTTSQPEPSAELPNRRGSVPLERRPKSPIPPPPRATPHGALDAQALKDTAVVLTQRGATRPAQAPTSSPKQDDETPDFDDSMSGDFLQVDYPATSLPPHDEQGRQDEPEQASHVAEPTPPLRSYLPSRSARGMVESGTHEQSLMEQQTPVGVHLGPDPMPSSLPAASLGPDELGEGDPLDSFIDVDEVNADLMQVDSWEEALPKSISRSAEPGPLMGELLEAEPLTDHPELSRPEPLSRALAHVQQHTGAPDDSVSQLDLADVWLSNESWDIKTEIGNFGDSSSATIATEVSARELTPHRETAMDSERSELSQLKLNYAHLEGEERWESALLIAQRARDEELDLDEAQRFFWEALRISEGRHAVAHSASEELAELLTVSQDHEGMLSLYDEMIARELKPLSELYRLRAVTLNALNRREEALQALDQAVASGGDGSVELRVTILTELGHVEEAVAHLDAAAEAHEGNMRPQARRARAIYLAQAAGLLKESYPQEALNRFKLAYEADERKERLEHWHQQALTVGDPYDQVEATEAYVEHLSQEPDTLALRVRLLTKLGRELEGPSPMHSLSLYQEALELEPESFELADLLCELSLRVEALEPLRVGLQRLLPLCLEGEYKGRISMRLAFTRSALGEQMVAQSTLREALLELGSVEGPLEEIEELREVIQWGQAMCSELVAAPLLRLIEESALGPQLSV